MRIVSLVSKSTYLLCWDRQWSFGRKYIFHLQTTLDIEPERSAERKVYYNEKGHIRKDV